MDFGIARVAGSDMTGTGTLLGTFGYMAPEYIRTGLPDPRSDLFAVGVMLYEALAGHRPFEGDTTATILYRLVNEEPAPLAAAEFHGVSPQTGALLAKALAKDPAHRFQTAGDMARALRDAKNPAWAGLPGTQPTRAMARPAEPLSKAAPPRRGPLLWPAIAVTLTLVAGGAGAWAWMHRTPAPRLITLPGPEPTAPAVPVIPPGPEAKVEPKMEPGSARRPAAVAAARPPSAQPRLSEQEATNLLDDAARGLVDQPQGSLNLCDRVLRDHPLNPRAYALKTVALYGAGRYQEMPGVLDAGKEHGVKPAQYLAFSAFTAMLREERRDRRLPREVRESLLAELPLGALKPGQGAWPQRVQRPSRD